MPRAFEGLIIPDGFVFPTGIRIFKPEALSYTTFEGSFTLPNNIVSWGERMFFKSTFVGTVVVLPNDLKTLEMATFLMTKWLEGAYLYKLPDSLEYLNSSTLSLNNFDNALIPLSETFTLKNTILIGLGSNDLYSYGALRNYKLPSNFALPDTIKIINNGTFGKTDFSALENKKLLIKNKDVYLAPGSGLTNGDVDYFEYENDENKLIGIDDIDSFIADPTNSIFEDYEGFQRLGFYYKTIPNEFVSLVIL